MEPRHKVALLRGTIYPIFLSAPVMRSTRDFVGRAAGHAAGINDRLTFFILAAHWGGPEIGSYRDVDSDSSLLGVPATSTSIIQKKSCQTWPSLRSASD